MVAGKLGKAQKSSGRLNRVLSREGADKRVSGIVFKAVVQQVLLFGAETWVLTPRIERALDSFMHGGHDTDHWETAAERVGREMVLPLPGGGHEGSMI